MTIELSNWVVAIGTSVTALVGIETLYFVVRELCHFGEHIRSASSTNNIYTQMIDIDKLFVENPDLKLYFYSNKCLEDNIRERDREQLFSVTEILVDYFDNVFQQKKAIGYSTFKSKGTYMRYFYKKSYILMKYIEHHVDWYQKGFIKYIRGEEDV